LKRAPRIARPALRRASAALCALALLLAARPAAAQPAAPPQPAAVPPPAAPAPAKPEPIPGAEAADRAQQETEQLRKIRERAAPEPTVTAIEERLVASAEEVAGFAATARERLGGPDLSQIDLERMSFDFERLRGRLGEWSATLTARAEALDADLALLGARLGVWKATRERAVAESQADAVIARIDKTLAAIERTERVARGRRNQILTLRENVARHQATVEEILDRVAGKREERRSRYFVLDKPPLWEALGEPGAAGGDLLGRMAAARANDLEDLRVFASDSAGALLALAGITLASIFAAAALRGPARRLAEEDAVFAATARVLERPVAAGLIVGLLAGALLVPNKPPVVQGLGHALVLLAALRLLVLLVGRELHPILYGLVAWYVIDRTRERLVPDLLASRLVLLAIAAAGIAGLLWLRRPARLAKLGELTRRPTLLRAIALGTQLALALSAVSILSNLVGNATLAEVLVEGTLATALFAFVAFAAARALDGFLALLLRSRAARRLRMVRNHESLLRRRGGTLIRAGAALAWAWHALRAFDALDPAVAGLRTALGAEWRLGELTLSLGGVLGFALMIWVSTLIARFVRFALEEDVLARASLPRGVPFAISTLARYAVLLLGFSMAVLAAGFDMSRLALMLGALGVGIGIGLQDIVNNVVSGLILLFERPVQVGDTVELGTLHGEVRRIGIRSSTVRTFDGAEVVIPNSQLVSEAFVNWTLSDRQRRIEIPVGVAYGSDPQRIIELLEGVVHARPEFLKQPPPVVLFDRLGESSLDFLVRAWAPDFDSSRELQGRLLLDIHRALREAGVEIPFPQRDLHLRSVAADLRTATAERAAAAGPPDPLRAAGPRRPGVG
jgi:small-conductance mechanosensitive channel